MALLTKKRRKQLAKYWGYLLLIPLYLGWFQFGWDPLPLGVLSGFIVLYFLFQAPVPCSAYNRDGETFCRNNAKGLLRGCSIKQHKWQNLMVLIRRDSWAQFARGVLRGFAGNAAAFGALAGLLSVVATLIVPFISTK